MKTTKELLDEQCRLWSQIQDIGHAIRSLQAIADELRQQEDAVDAELRKRCESMRALLLAQQNNGEAT